jgi:hypothetical protein
VLTIMPRTVDRHVAEEVGLQIVILVYLATFFQHNKPRGNRLLLCMVSSSPKDSPSMSDFVMKNIFNQFCF